MYFMYRGTLFNLTPIIVKHIRRAMHGCISFRATWLSTRFSYFTNDDGNNIFDVLQMRFFVIANLAARTRSAATKQRICYTYAKYIPNENKSILWRHISVTNNYNEKTKSKKCIEISKIYINRIISMHIPEQLF